MCEAVGQFDRLRHRCLEIFCSKALPVSAGRNGFCTFQLALSEVVPTRFCFMQYCTCHCQRLSADCSRCAGVLTISRLRWLVPSPSPGQPFLRARRRRLPRARGTAGPTERVPVFRRTSVTIKAYSLGATAVIPGRPDGCEDSHGNRDCKLGACQLPGSLAGTRRPASLCPYRVSVYLGGNVIGTAQRSKRSAVIAKPNPSSHLFALA